VKHKQVKLGLFRQYLCADVLEVHFVLRCVGNKYNDLYLIFLEKMRVIFFSAPPTMASEFLEPRSMKFNKKFFDPSRFEKNDFLDLLLLFWPESSRKFRLWTKWGTLSNFAIFWGFLIDACFN